MSRPRRYTKKQLKERRKASNKKRKLQHKYGLTLDQYHDMLTSCEYKCEICTKELVKPYIDHNHTTGQVRGILCMNCNFALGHFFDSTDLMNKAIQYMELRDNGRR